MIESPKLKGSLFLVALSAILLAGCQSNAERNKVATDDPCGANQYKQLIGTSAKSIDLSKFPSGTRLLYPTTPMTRDYRINRLNIHASKDGTVIRLDCN